MNVQDYLKILRKRWITIVVVTLVGIGAAAAYVITSTKVYTASAQVFVAASSAEGTAALNNGNIFAQARVQSYTSVANSPEVTSAVIKALRAQAAKNGAPAPTMTSRQLAGKITADAPQDKVLLNIHVNDTSPVQAATLANAVASQLVNYVQQIEKASAGSFDSPVKLTVIHPAQVPDAPTSPQTTLDVIIGFIAGLLLGLGLAVLRETLDTRMRTAADIGDATGAAVLAVVPTDKRTEETPIATRVDDFGARAEAYRQLRANLQYIAVDSPPRVISINSALSGEGKSLTAINLAATIADAGMKVFLVDADLRRPSIAKYLGLVSDTGLTSVLANKASIADVIQPVGSNLAVIASGPIPPNPSELLSSVQFRNLLSELREMAEFVIIDNAPLLPVADGREVAAAADVSLLVARAGGTTREDLKQSLAALQRVGAQLGGIVFNMVSSREAGTYYQYYGSDREKVSPQASRA